MALALSISTLASSWSTRLTAAIKPPRGFSLRVRSRHAASISRWSSHYTVSSTQFSKTQHLQELCRGNLHMYISRFGEAGHTRFPCSKLKLDNLFLQWLSTHEAQQLVGKLVADATFGRLLSGPAAGGSPVSTNCHSALFTASVPPLSPIKAKPVVTLVGGFSKRISATSLKAQIAATQEIPQFYFPHGKPVSATVMSSLHCRLSALFGQFEEGLTVAALKTVLTEVFDLPSVLAYPLFYKLVPAGGSLTVTSESLAAWMDLCSFKFSQRGVQTYEILRQQDCAYVTKADLKSMLAGILLSHPGLEFLHDTPEFQERYAETVIYRVFHKLDRYATGRLQLKDFQQGSLLRALEQLDTEDDINKILLYFSYEHFYVIYCKFWELDSDHDFYLSKEDLLRYGNHSLTYRIVDRIFSQTGRPFSSKVEGKMNYEDFVWFISNEEDKSNDHSLEYWFRCVDLDGDGCLRASEMLYFYEEQLHRMECLNQEPVLFEDVLCQMHDMIHPANEGVFTLRDLKRTKSLSGTLFNILFNLNKFIAFETRDPFVVRQEREDAGLTDWDRFARCEYLRLSMEEEGEDLEADASSDVWENSLDGAF